MNMLRRASEKLAAPAHSLKECQEVNIFICDEAVIFKMR